MKLVRTRYQCDQCGKIVLESMTYGRIKTAWFKVSCSYLMGDGRDTRHLCSRDCAVSALQDMANTLKEQA